MLTEKVNSMLENVIQKEPNTPQVWLESMSGAIPETMNARRKKADVGV